MKWKKAVSLCLIGAMSAALLAGCGSEEQTEATGNAGGSGAASAPEESAASGAFAGFDDLQTLDMYALSFYGDDGVQEVQDAINAISREAINVEVNYHPLDVAGYMQQIGLMLSGGEAFDLVLCTAIPNVSFGTMQSQNQLLDISGYLDEYAPETKEMMADYLPATTIGDAVYAIPCYRPLNSSYYIMMRKDILDELGLTEQAQAVDSWSGFEEIMKAVRDGMDSLPAEMQVNSVICNSDAQGTINTCTYTNVAADKFAEDSSYDNLGDNSRLIYVDESTNTVGNYFATDAYRESIERVHKWYEEDLIYKDAATSSETGDTLLKNGIAFAYYIMAEYGAVDLKTIETGHELVGIKVVDAPIQTASANQWAWAVPVTSENPEAAVAFLNLMYTNADIENLFVYGIEGRDYEMLDNGEASRKEDLVYHADEYFFGNRFNAYPGEGAGPNVREEALADMEAAEISPYFGCVVNTDPIANELTAIANVLAKYEAGLESGSSDPANLDKMLAELEDSGAQKVIDYYQSVLDEWMEQQ